jgi:heavy metal sensor kinase
VIGRLRPKSVRVRLTLWYVAIFSLILLIYGGFVYGLLRGNLVSEMDRRLREDVETAEELLDDYVSNPSVLESLQSRDRWLLEVWSVDGALAYSAPRAAVSRLGPPDSACAGRRLRTEAIKLEDGLRIRTACKTVEVDGKRLTIRSARSADRIHEELREVLLMLGLGFPLAIGAAALGGYFLARRALLPIARMNEQARSITAEKLAERLKIENPEDELGSLARTFNETFARLEGSFDQMRRFTADASHELRTPLTAIRTMGEVALRDGLNKRDHSETLSSILEETDYLRHLVESLLTLSRADAGQLKLRLEDVDLGALVREVGEHLCVLAEEKGQRLKTHVSSPVPSRVDRTLLRQAVINLVDNAIKYSPDGTEVELRASKTDRHAVIEVIDRGEGIPAEHLPKIFDRFYRVDASRTRSQGGAGLGLAIAKWATEIHGGRLEIESQVGRGTRLRIVLPIV